MEDRERIYHKIRSLLRKAESSTHEAEAHAYLAKASELMLAYAVDEETLWASEPDKRPKPIIRSFEIGNKTGAMHMRVLLSACARANRCRMWYDGPTSYVAGFESDVVYVEMLYTSLTVQMNFALAVGLAHETATGGGKSYRANFIAGYANRVYRRLVTDASPTSTGTSTSKDLVRHRTAEVDKFVDAYVGRLSHRTHRSNTTGHGYSSGREAGDKADISGGRNKIGTGRKAIGGST